MHGPDALLSPAQAATLLGVSPHTVRRWIRRGEVCALRLGDADNGPLRVPISELLERMKAARPHGEHEREVEAHHAHHDHL
jgi:excisionase family DNA binding protein